MTDQTNFKKLIEKVKRDQPNVYERSLQSLQWYRKKIEKEFSTKTESPLNIYETRPKKQLPFAGQLMTFQYDPKNKKTLPFYDKYPLILTLDIGANSILGLNFHYIKPLHRVFFMDELYKYLGTRFDTPVFKVDYERLLKKANFRYYKPCIKRYLYKNISQKVSILTQDEWELALFLPTEKFTTMQNESITKEKIWDLSSSIIKKV